MQLAQQLIAEDGSPPSDLSKLHSLCRCCCVIPPDTADDWKIVLAFLRALPEEFRANARDARAWRVCRFAGWQHQRIDRRVADTRLKSLGRRRNGSGCSVGGSSACPVPNALSAGERRPLFSQSHRERTNAAWISTSTPITARAICPGCTVSAAMRATSSAPGTSGQLVVAACERARRQGLADPWLRPTLLGAAFDARRYREGQRTRKEVATDGAVAWQLRDYPERSQDQHPVYQGRRIARPLCRAAWKTGIVAGLSPH